MVLKSFKIVIKHIVFPLVPPNFNHLKASQHTTNIPQTLSKKKRADPQKIQLKNTTLKLVQKGFQRVCKSF